MTDLAFRNLLMYVLLWVANVLAICAAAALAAGTMPGFQEGQFFAPASSVVLGSLMLAVPTLTGWLAANRPRIGSEQLAADVDKQRKAGRSRRALKVTPKVVEEPVPPELVTKLADELEKRREERVQARLQSKMGEPIHG